MHCPAALRSAILPGMVEAPRARSPRGKVLSIQYLRAIAAIAVAVYHCGTDAHWRNAWPLKGFSSGVDVFFVISGFIMWSTTARGAIGPREFWRRRIERIVPLYWIATTFAVLVAIVSSRYGGKTSLWHVISSYAFLPATSPKTHYLEPIISPGWTLNYEMYFYAILGALLVVSARKRFIGTAAALTGVVIAAALASGRFVPLEFYGNSIVFEFLFGMSLGVLFASARLNLPVRWAWVAMAVGVILLGTIDSIHYTARVLSLGIPALIIVGSALCLEHAGAVREWKIPLLLGDASYSIYLSHGVFLSGYRSLYFKTSLPSIGFFLSGLVGSVVFGLLVYRFIETPIARRIRERRRRGARPVASDPAVADVVAAKAVG